MITLVTVLHDEIVVARRNNNKMAVISLHAFANSLVANIAGRSKKRSTVDDSIMLDTISDDDFKCSHCLKLEMARLLEEDSHYSTSMLELE